MNRKNKMFIIYISCAITIFLFTVIVLGMVMKMFLTVPYFDKSLHFLSAALISCVFGFWISSKAKMRLLYAMLFVFCFATTIGILFELIEFTIDSLFASNHQHWIGTEADRFGFIGATLQGSGLIDTMGDIVANTIGAAIASIIGLIWLKRKERIQ